MCNLCNIASDLKDASKAGVVCSAAEKFDSHINDDVDNGPPHSLQGSIHLPKQVSSRSKPQCMKKKKKRYVHICMMFMNLQNHFFIV